MPFRLPHSALGRLLAVAVALSMTRCVSTQTSRTLDGSFDLAGARLREAPRKPSSNEANAEADLPESVDRDGIVAEVVARSPGLALMAHRARALVHAGRAEGSLPSAEVGFEAWNLPLARPYAVGEADMYMIELRQRLPAAGALDARARAMAEEAQAILGELASEERLVAERAASAFASYAQAVQGRRLLEQQLGLLPRMSQAAVARYSTGGSNLVDAARIEIEVAKTQRALARVAGEITRSRATLNAMLRRPPGTPLGEPRELSAETVRLSLDELTVIANANRGATLSADARLRAAAARHDAAEAEARTPDFMLGLGYWQDPTMRPGMGVTASMTLPWLWGPARHRVEQAREEEAAERAARDGAGIEAQNEIGEARAQLDALEAQLLVVETQGLPTARRSLDAVAASYTTGGATLLDWVDVTRSMLDLEIEALELRAELARGVASLERAVGALLPRSPIREDASHDP